jgi:hypothetical protein
MIGIIERIWPLRTIMRCWKYFLLARHLENRTVMVFTVGEGRWEQGPGSSESFARKSYLDNSRKRCNMTFRDPKPPTAFLQETEKERPAGDQA